MSRRRRRLCAGLCALFGMGSASYAQGRSPAKACDAFARVPVPVADRPTRAEALQLTKCDSLSLYYGSADPGRFRKARLCALANDGVTRDSPAEEGKSRTVDSEMLDASSDLLVLAMLYANGEGVTRNVNLARHFDCGHQDWDVGPEESLKALVPGKRFEVCEADGTSQYGRISNYHCLVVAQARVDRETKFALVRAERGMSPGVSAVFKRLQQARSAFQEARGPELPNGNTGAVQSGMGMSLEADRAWLGALESIGIGKLPDGVAESADLAAEDKDLNKQYQSVLQTATASCPTGVDAGGIGCLGPMALRAAERAWLQYREVWVKFGAVRFPTVPGDRWRSWLTAERLEELGSE